MPDDEISAVKIQHISTTMDEVRKDVKAIRADMAASAIKSEHRFTALETKSKVQGSIYGFLAGAVVSLLSVAARLLHSS